MTLDQVKELTPFQRVCYWIRERESIRLKKEAGEKKPWTNDPILQSYRFCNVRRMDDKVSQWLLKNWYEPYFNHKQMVVACVLARHFNQPSTLEAIGFPNFPGLFPWSKYVEVSLRTIAKLQERSQTTFNGAYIVRADGKFPNKADMVFNETCQQFVDHWLYVETDYMEAAVNQLCEYRNIGSFMAGQIAADLRWAVKGEWKDRNTWAAIGPGSKKGMNILHGRLASAPLNQDQFIVELREFRAAALKELPASIVNRMEMIDWQNCFCELSKYTKALTGNGRPKQLYAGV